MLRSSTQSQTRGVMPAALMAVVLVVTAANVALVAPFVAPMTWALTLAVVTYPLHVRITRWIGHRSLAAGCSTLLVTLVICVPFVYAGAMIVEEAVDAGQSLKGTVNPEAVQEVVPDGSPLRPAAEWLSRQLQRANYREQAATFLMNGARTAASRSLYVATEALITVFIVFYFFRDGRRFLRRAPRVLPVSSAESRLVCNRVGAMIRAMVYGTLVVSLLQGALGGLAFWWLDLPAPFLWGGIMALASVLPVFGAAIVWVPVALYLAFTGDVQSALILAGWGAVAIGLVDNVLKPRLVNRQVRLHTLVIFIAVLGGLVVYGPTGVMLGPIVVAAGVALWDVWQHRRMGAPSPR